MTELTEKFIEKPDAFNMTAKEYFYTMPQSEVVRMNQMLNLLTACLQDYIER
jgi:hypothetical protein